MAFFGPFASGSGGGGVTDHGALTGLADDDHSQYHNDTRGDARYYTQTQLNAGQLDTRYYTESEVDALVAGAGGDAWGDAVDADVVPDGDNTRDLGSASARFAEIYGFNFLGGTDAVADANPAADITIQGTNKTAGTGDGGDVLINGGTSVGGNPGRLIFSSDSLACTFGPVGFTTNILFEDTVENVDFQVKSAKHAELSLIGGSSLRRSQVAFQGVGSTHFVLGTPGGNDLYLNGNSAIAGSGNTAFFYRGWTDEFFLQATTLKITSPNLSFFGATAVTQPTAVADPTGGLTVDTECRTQLAELIDKLQSLGLIGT